MSKIIKQKIKCPKCNNEQECSLYSSINVTVDPELKEKISDNSFNLFECKKCNLKAPIGIECLYHNMDKDNGFAVWYTPNGINELHQKFTQMGNHLLGVDNYMSRTLFFKDRLSFVLGVRLCETNGSPKTQETVDKYYTEVGKMKNEIEQAMQVVQNK